MNENIVLCTSFSNDLVQATHETIDWWDDIFKCWIVMIGILLTYTDLIIEVFWISQVERSCFFSLALVNGCLSNCPESDGVVGGMLSGQTVDQ